MCLKLCDGSLSKYLYGVLVALDFCVMEKCFVGPNPIKELGTGGEMQVCATKSRV